MQFQPFISPQSIKLFVTILWCQDSWEEFTSAIHPLLKIPNILEWPDSTGLHVILVFSWRFGFGIIVTETTDAYCLSFCSKGSKPSHVRYQLYESDRSVMWIYTTRAYEIRPTWIQDPIFKRTLSTRLCVFEHLTEYLKLTNFSEETKPNYSLILLNHTSVLQEK